MQELRSFTIAISPSLEIDEREKLLLLLRSQATIEQTTSRSVGPEDFKTLWDTFMIIMKVAGPIIGTAAATFKLANEINVWRRQAHERGIVVLVYFEQPSKKRLDLSTATDDEVLQWLLQEPTMSEEQEKGP